MHNIVLGRLKTREWKILHNVAGVENARVELHGKLLVYILEVLALNKLCKNTSVIFHCVIIVFYYKKNHIYCHIITCEERNEIT